MLPYYSAVARTLLVGFNFFLVFFFIWKCRRVLGGSFKEINRSYYVGLLGIAFTLILIYAFLVPPKHYVYTDEFLYQLAAKSVLTQGHFGALLKSQGWAFLIFLGYFFAGLNNYVSIYLAEFLGIGAVACFFFFLVWAGADRYRAFLATLIFAFIPARVFWASTAESHTAALFFVLLAMAFSFLFYSKRERSLFWLALLTWSFAIQIRGEAVFLLALFFIGIRLFVSEAARRNVPRWEGLFIAACLFAPQLLLGLKFVTGYSKEATTTQFWQGMGPLNFLHNLLKYGRGFFAGEAHPFALTAAATAGAIELFFKNRRLLVFHLLWFCVLFAVYFSVWFDWYGADFDFFPKTRILLFFYPPLLFFASFALGRFVFQSKSQKTAAAAIVAAAMVFWSVPSYGFFLRDDFQLAQMKVIDYAERSISKADIVVALHPEVFTGTTSLAVVRFEDLLKDSASRRQIFARARTQGGRVLFLETMGVTEMDFLRIWPVFRDDFRAVPVKMFSRGKAQFMIYQLSPF